MTRQVWLTIIGEQTDEDGDREKNALQCKASYEYREGIHYLEYDEIDEEGKLTSHAKLQLGADAVTLIRDGELCSVMYFRSGKEMRGKYSTPFGEIPMSVRTKKISLLENGDKVHGRIFYDLIMEGVGTRKSILIIKTEPI